jgi:hypothetical protein
MSDINEILNYRTTSSSSSSSSFLDQTKDSLFKLPSKTINMFTSGEPRLIEHLTAQEALIELSSDDVNNNDNILKSIETQVVIKDDSIREVQNETDQIYKFIYTIFIGIFILIILGIFTYVKNILQLNNNIYMLFVIIIIFSYVIYIMYIYNFMYMKDTTNKILNFIKYGKVELTNKVDFNLLPTSIYKDNLCKKRTAEMNPNVVSNTTSSNISSSSSNNIQSNNYRNLPTGEEGTHFYNDGDAPKLLMYPTQVPSTQYGDIVYPDSDRDQVDKTYRL